MGLFGILWTVLAVAMTANAPFPFVGIVFPAFGVIFTLLAWGSAVYNLVNATSQQRFAEYDFVAGGEEPDPLQAKFGSASPATRSQPEKFCTSCAAPLQPAFRYCPQCGTKV